MTDRSDRPLDRRAYLTALAAAAGARTLSGCVADDSGTTARSTPAGTGTDAATARAAGRTNTAPNSTAERTDTPLESTAGRTDTATATETDSAPESTTARSTPASTGRTRGSTPARTRDLFPGYRTTAVVVRSPGGERLGAVTAAIADTPSLRYTGLSDTESLPSDWGMLFVFEQAGAYPFVMRGMSFGLDIVFADADRTITRIHHAPKPGPDEDGTDQRYPGFGQYVLEVNRGWTTERGVSNGDVLEFEL